jgi:hypothetical protein
VRKIVLSFPVKRPVQHFQIQAQTTSRKALGESAPEKERAGNFMQ